MHIEDIDYLCSNISTLWGIPIRLYDESVYKSFYYSSKTIVDPVKLYEEEILKSDSTISYITTEDFFYYAKLKHLSFSIVVGPFRLIKADEVTLSKMALKLELNKEDFYEFVEAMQSINSVTLESILQTLCVLCFVLNKEKLSLKDILIGDDEVNTNLNTDEKEETITSSGKAPTNNSYVIEQQLYRIVENGRVDELKSWIKNAPAIRPGVLANDTIRHTKNLFIATTTLISRSAIKGHMDVSEALALSDLYIQKMELLKNSLDIYTLQMNMILDFTERVEKIRYNSNSSELIINLNKYILAHISDAIKTDDVCSALYISKSSLFEKIKKETNMTFSNYVLSVKANEAKTLLKHTNRSISSISTYLGFSSQSHFNHAFKKITNRSPLEYRANKKLAK